MKREKTMAKTSIRKNDVVQLIAGKGAAGAKRRIKDGEDAGDRQLRGKVLSVDLEKNRALVEGAKMVFKHQRQNKQDPSAPKVGRIEREAPVQLSNLMLVCPKCDEATRVGIRTEEYEREGGKKKTRRVRVCKRCGADIPERT